VTARIIGPGGTVDVSDRAGRLAGVVTVEGLPPARATGELPVADDYEAGEVLADQVAPAGGAVLAFAFAAPVSLVLVEVDAMDEDDVARLDPFGGVPAAGRGIRARHATPTFVPVLTAAVAVWAPAGASVSVAGFRRA
jgi:hypothetical protein